VEGDRQRVTIYTDGGADPNPGPGGWAAILIHDASGRVKEISGGEPYTTNNRMELTAAIEALSALREPCEVRLLTDSEYLRSGITRWAEKWQADGWVRGKKKQPVENADLWQRLLAVAARHEIAWKWVRGHTGDRYNERADSLATQEIRRLHAEEPGRGGADAEVYLLVSVQGSQGMWVAQVRYRGEEQVLYGQEHNVTSNQMDIAAATAALSTLPEEISVRVYSLSDYLRNGATQWLRSWKQRGWRTKQGEPVKNRELWERLDAELTMRAVEWPPVKDDPAFEFAFEDLARRAQEEIEEQFRRRDGWDGYEE
jgi:ribonuclease HI